MLKALYTSSNKNKFIPLFKNNYPAIRECNEANLHILYRNSCPPDYMPWFNPCCCNSPCNSAHITILYKWKMYVCHKWIAPSALITSPVNILTKRAPYKMYEIMASSNLRPHLIRPLTSSVTEPPLHSWKGAVVRREKRQDKPSVTQYTCLGYKHLPCKTVLQHKSGNNRTHFICNVNINIQQPEWGEGRENWKL